MEIVAIIGRKRDIAGKRNEDQGIRIKDLGSRIKEFGIKEFGYLRSPTIRIQYLATIIPHL
ncbi:MAG: hypothetical protein R2834_24095, partial [Rhodothermales bacterium]